MKSNLPARILHIDLDNIISLNSVIYNITLSDYVLQFIPFMMKIRGGPMVKWKDLYKLEHYQHNIYALI